MTIVLSKITPTPTFEDLSGSGELRGQHGRSDITAPQRTEELSPPAGASREAFNFDRWYREYSGLVKGIIRKAIVDSHAAEDISQRVWSQLAARGDRYDPSRSKETTFISLVTKRAIIDHLRREGSRAARIPQVSFDTTNTSAHGSDMSVACRESSPLEGLCRTEEVRNAREELRSLEPHKRVLLEQMYGRGRSIEEVALDLEMPVGSVKSLLSRTLKQLRTRWSR